MYFIVHFLVKQMLSDTYINKSYKKEYNGISHRIIRLPNSPETDKGSGYINQR